MGNACIKGLETRAARAIALKRGAAPKWRNTRMAEHARRWVRVCRKDYLIGGLHLGGQGLGQQLLRLLCTRQQLLLHALLHFLEHKVHCQHIAGSSSHIVSPQCRVRDTSRSADEETVRMQCRGCHHERRWRCVKRPVPRPLAFLGSSTWCGSAFGSYCWTACIGWPLKAWAAQQITSSWCRCSLEFDDLFIPKACINQLPSCRTFAPSRNLGIWLVSWRRCMHSRHQL
jgi:hypothetical protein